MPFYDLLWLNVYFQTLDYCQDLSIKPKPKLIFTELQYFSLLTPSQVWIINKTIVYWYQMLTSGPRQYRQY